MVAADLMANAPRVTSSPDFPTLLADNCVRMPVLDNSYNMVVSVPNNVHPFLHSLSRDVQAKLLANVQHSSSSIQQPPMVAIESRVHELQSKVAFIFMFLYSVSH